MKPKRQNKSPGVREPNGAIRAANGQLMKGSVLNPGGRPGWLKEISVELETATKKGLELLLAVINGEPFKEEVEIDGVMQVRDRTPRLSDRIHAAEIALTYTLIKPTQKVDLSVSQVPQWISETTKEEALKILKAADETVTVDAEPPQEGE